MNDTDGPVIAGHFYDSLLKNEVIQLDGIPYALDFAVQKLRALRVPPHRWAPFIHIGA